ncbi:MAG TPA: hypothetical protein VHB72_02705 [Candidatus Saccharimonadales bacterium]|nr:hypothetical protein [Candidatus Saccharimonadales bacterium]
MSERVNNMDNTFRWIGYGRDHIAETQAKLDDDYRRHFGHYFAVREEMFGELEDDGYIRGENIADYAEASMRLDGVSAAEASEKAAQLAKIFTPSAGDPALPIYFRSGERRQGDRAVLAIRPASASEDSLHFALARDNNNSEIHDLVLTAEGTPNVFREGYLSLSSGGGNTVHWTYGWQGTASVNLRGLKITDDPEEASELTRKAPSVLMGEAAIEAIDPDEHEAHEDVALKAIITGQQPAFRDDSFNRDTVEGQTQKRIAAYATRLLTAIEGGMLGLRDRVPVQFHPAVLPLVLSQAEVETALLEGVADAGDVLSSDAISLIEEVVASKPRHRNTGQIIDAAIIDQLEALESIADSILIDSGVDIEPRSLMHAALQDPVLYRSLALRWKKPTMSTVAREAVWAYIAGTPRFRGLRHSN